MLMFFLHRLAVRLVFCQALFAVGYLLFQRMASDIDRRLAIIRAAVFFIEFFEVVADVFEPVLPSVTPIASREGCLWMTAGITSEMGTKPKSYKEINLYAIFDLFCFSCNARR
jgi:hypothetical protein